MQGEHFHFNIHCCRLKLSLKAEKFRHLSPSDGFWHSDDKSKADKRVTLCKRIQIGLNSTPHQANSIEMQNEELPPR